MIEGLEPLLPGTPTGWYPDPAGKKRARYWDGLAWTSNVSDSVAPKPVPIAEEIRPLGVVELEPLEDQWKRRVAVTTSHELAGHKVVEHLGEVFGITVRTRNMFSDFAAGLRNAVGGEVRGYTKLLVGARNECLLRLRQEAAQAGANAVIAMRMTSNSLTDGVTEVVAYGSAVRVEPVLMD